jgi:hypothetical protein
MFLFQVDHVTRYGEIFRLDLRLQGCMQSGESYSFLFQVTISQGI